jgi:hypothetical protein
MTSPVIYFPCFIVLLVDADLCHRGWVHHDESCYLFPRSELDWFSAAVSITVKVSVTFLISIYKQNDKTREINCRTRHGEYIPCDTDQNLQTNRVS